MPGMAPERKPTERTDQLICTAPYRRAGSIEGHFRDPLPERQRRGMVRVLRRANAHRLLKDPGVGSALWKLGSPFTTN